MDIFYSTSFYIHCLILTFYKVQYNYDFMIGGFFMKVYLDNAATSFPKPASVTNDMLNYMTNLGCSPGRGSYHDAIESSKLVLHCRESLCKLFNFSKPENVIFTSNITHSLNILLRGFLKPGDHVITSSMEHNSVLRPLQELKDSINIDLTILQCDKNGLIPVEQFKKAIRPDTHLAIFTHGSNIIGTIEPLELIGKICSDNNIDFIVDSAQSAGAMEVNFEKLHCSALAFTGHKSLLGPQGIGGFLITDEFNNKCSTIFSGGTGSLSSELHQPIFLPDKFESGTLNTPGIVGLSSGVNFILEEGVSAIEEKKHYLNSALIDGLLNIDDVIFYGYKDISLRTSAISIGFKNKDIAEVAYLLDSEFGIMVRTGLHCAPLAHKTIGTYPSGTLRLSPGYFNDIKDIKYTLDSINHIL